MSCKAKSVTIELIGIKKPSALGELINTVPKPKGAVPNFGLPRWTVMPLESKIPMIPGPEGSYSFTRRKLGRKLWVGSADAEFNLSDPYNYETEFSYHPLHDEHLAPFFSQPKNIQRILKLGLVTKTLDAKCSLRDYNMYRKYLKKLHNDSINKELKRRAALDTEKRALSFAEECAQQEIERLKQQEKRAEAVKSVRDQLELQKEARIQKQRDKESKLAKRVELIASARAEKAKLQLEESKYRSDIIKKKRIAAAEIERHKIIKTLIEWNKREYECKKAMERRRIQEMAEKRKAIENRWKLRQELQKKQMGRELFLLNCAHQEHVMNIQAYNEKVKKERERMQMRLEKCKIFTKCYIGRHIAGQKEISCCIKRKRKHKAGESYKVKGKMEKKRSKNKKKRKGKKRKLSLPVSEPEIEPIPESEPIEMNMSPAITPTTPLLNSECVCEDIKAKWLKASMNKT